MTHLQAFISDVDGTLIDTLEIIRRGQYEAAMAHFREIGMLAEDLPDYEKYQDVLRKVVGGHVRETLESTSTLLYEDRPDIRSVLDFDRMAELLKTIQDELAHEQVKSYSGLQTLLKSIGSQNIAFGLFTSGRPHHVVRNFGVALSELNLQNLYNEHDKSDQEKLDVFREKFKSTFAIEKFAIITGDDVSAHKPDPESVYAVLDQLDVQPKYAAALGDHVVDMKAAKSAGVPVRIGVTHGFDDALVLRAEGATKVVDSLDEVTQYLQNQE